MRDAGTCVRRVRPVANPEVRSVPAANNQADADDEPLIPDTRRRKTTDWPIAPIGPPRSERARIPSERMVIPFPR